MSIVSDRDKVFTSKFWQELFRLMGVELHLSSSYHPQTDGQSERLNQCLENFLRCMTSEHPTHWHKWLSLAELWYNTTFHSGLQATPFEALYGYKPTHVPLGPYQDTIIPGAKDLVQERIRISQSIREQLDKAQQRMTYFANQHRTERTLAVGDYVFLKLQPYRQQSLAIRKSLKLAAKYYGPFEILEKVGQVSYRLKLPEGARIHPIFHVSLLKKKIGPYQHTTPTMPEFDMQDQCILEPEAILKRRVILRNDQPVIQYLIKWTNMDSDEASWEDASIISHQFPLFQP